MGFSANAQGLPKSQAPAPKEKITPEPWESVISGLKENEDPNPERFKTGPLFPKGAPQRGTPDAPSEDDLRDKTGDGKPYVGS